MQLTKREEGHTHLGGAQVLNGWDLLACEVEELETVLKMRYSTQKPIGSASESCDGYAPRRFSSRSWMGLMNEMELWIKSAVSRILTERKRQ